MTASVPPERTPAQQFALALGRLRALVMEYPLRTEAVREQALACGRHGYAAGHSLAVVVDLLAGIVPEYAYRSPDLPIEIIGAASAAYIEAAEEAERGTS